MKAFASTVGILTDPKSFVDGIRGEPGLPRRFWELLLLSCLLMAFYGVWMGAYGGAPQALSSAIKLPLLFLVTAAICFPTLFILLQFSGARIRAGHYLTIVQAAIAVASLILVAFAPVSAFFLMTASNYAFFKLLNVAILAFAAVMGVRFLYANILRMANGEENPPQTARTILNFWVLLFAFVGSQMGWTLRPFFGAPNMPFEAVREVGGNFYVDIGRSIQEVMSMDERSGAVAQRTESSKTADD